MLTAEERLTALTVHRLEHNGHGFTLPLAVHHFQGTHQQHRAVAPLDLVGPAKGAVRLAVGDAKIGQRAYRRLMDLVHLVKVGEEVAAAQPLGLGGVFLLGLLGQRPVEQHRRVLPGDAAPQTAGRDPQAVLRPQKTGLCRSRVARQIPGGAFLQSLLVSVGGEGAGGHSEKLTPAQGASGGDLVAAHSVDDPQVNRPGHLGIGPVAGAQVGITGRLSGQSGQGQGASQQQGSHPGEMVPIHVQRLSLFLFGVPQ